MLRHECHNPLTVQLVPQLLPENGLCLEICTLYFCITLSHISLACVGSRAAGQVCGRERARDQLLLHGRGGDARDLRKPRRSLPQRACRCAHPALPSIKVFLLTCVALVRRTGHVDYWAGVALAESTSSCGLLML